MEPVKRIAPDVSVRTLVAAPRLIVCAPPEVSTVRESAERVVTPCQLNGLLKPAVVNEPEAELESAASAVGEVKRAIVPLVTLAKPVPVASVTSA